MAISIFISKNRAEIGAQKEFGYLCHRGNLAS